MRFNHMGTLWIGVCAYLPLKDCGNDEMFVAVAVMPECFCRASRRSLNCPFLGGFLGPPALQEELHYSISRSKHEPATG